MFQTNYLNKRQTLILKSCLYLVESRAGEGGVDFREKREHVDMSGTRQMLKIASSRSRKRERTVRKGEKGQKRLKGLPQTALITDGIDRPGTRGAGAYQMCEMGRLCKHHLHGACCQQMLNKCILFF